MEDIVALTTIPTMFVLIAWIILAGVLFASAIGVVAVVSAGLTYLLHSSK